MKIRLLCAILLISVSVPILQGCVGVARKAAVPETQATRAEVPGLSDVRYRVGIDNEAIVKEGIQSYYREKAYYSSLGKLEGAKHVGL